MVPSSTPVPSVCQNNRRGRRASCQREGAWWHLVKLVNFLLTDLLVRKNNRGRTDKVLSCPAVTACCVFSVNQVTLIEIQI